MLGYAWRVLTRHRSLWGPTAACALVAAVPGVLVATVLSPSLTALLLSGDPVVAYRLLPDPLVSGGVTGALAWTGIAAATIVILAAWTRLYIAALWISLEERDSGFGTALKVTKSRWRTAFIIHLEALLAVGTVLCATGFLFFIGPTGGGGGTGAFLVITIVLLFRSVVRVASTLALRAATFDNVDHLTSWRRGFEIMHIRRSEALAAWMMLVAIGAALWIGGRLITPVLQETLLAYPYDSGYTTARGTGAAHLCGADRGIPPGAFDRSVDGRLSRRRRPPRNATDTPGIGSGSMDHQGARGAGSARPHRQRDPDRDRCALRAIDGSRASWRRGTRDNP